MGAWNGWYHVSTHTYGTWLPGDERGWRARHHKTHVEGDYRHPPPAGRDRGLLRHSKDRMKDDPVFLDPDERRIAGQALVEMLIEQGVELLDLSLDAVHCHLLARFGTAPIRQAVGRAKKHAYYVVRGHAQRTRLWGTRCRPEPITGRSHQLNVYKYILGHADKGAWVWTFKQGLYWRE